MMNSIKERLGREEEGFTLIELMVVLLIIAILMAIAIPTFLGSRNTANARSAQENLRNALTAEQSYFTSTNSFSADTTVMSPLEHSLNWSTTAATSSGGNTVTVTVGDNSNAGDTVFLQAYGSDGNCYTIEATDDSSYNTGPTTGYAQNPGACTTPTASTKFVDVQASGGAAGNPNTAKATFPAKFYPSF